MASLLANIRRANAVAHLPVAEPFAGGAGASLSLLYLEETPEVFINDADPAIYDFWWTIVNRPSHFLGLLHTTPVSIQEWRRQRRIYQQRRTLSRVQRGFSAFYLNRCNRSGIIINGGPVGGQDQLGPWKLTARFNRQSLLLRCRRLTEYSGRIHVSGLDGISFIDRIANPDTFLFIDPPYYHKGRMLYLDVPGDSYHTALAAKLQTLPSTPWVLTYDDCPEIRRLYRSWARIRRFRIGYAASERRMGHEVLITPKWMRLPAAQRSAAISW